MKKYWIGAFFAVSALAGCTAKINSALQLNGQPFVPTTCRSGQAFGFSGVEFTDQDGVRLRLLANADGTARRRSSKPAALRATRLDNAARWR
jgi:hypothetical protein